MCRRLPTCPSARSPTCVFNLQHVRLLTYPPVCLSACTPVRLLARPPSRPSACLPACSLGNPRVRVHGPPVSYVCMQDINPACSRSTRVLWCTSPRPVVTVSLLARVRLHSPLLDASPSQPRTRLLFVGPICLLSIMRAVLQQRRASTTAAAATSWHDDAGGYELTRRWGTEYSGTRGTRLGRGQHSEHGARGSEHAREREGASEDDDGGGDELAQCCERRIVAVSWGRTGTTGTASSERGGGGGEQGGQRRRRRARR
ncbi:uncharacterized protein B0H18DRAFT_987098 [Fomitopsis serialis]|uniref:uncharacterized protein n=1 Tax=Fomitopsis serialis TaxID=139415 RepID=UPI002007BCBA|nr:uncharacterized protein B0H18DRAFT_987098 [Neoantrodia serialis]KAH9932214.1 hypothetical protein B0H18DRAFT_987098 [Neoantrodia serialis]